MSVKLQDRGQTAIPKGRKWRWPAVWELWIRQVALAPFVLTSSPLLYRLAWLWRRALVRTTFIAITGSVGKTTAKELLADILASRGRTFRSLGNQCGGLMVSLNVLRVRPWHRFAVLEIGVTRPGSMRPLARVVRPDVAVILTALRTHTQGFESLDEHAAEKAVLLESLRPGGLAVLNGDDPRVARMADRGEFRVCLTGTSPDFDLWASDVSSRWPERLSLRAHRGEESCEMKTQLLGVHWAPVLMAALGAAGHLGISLADAARVLRRAAPYPARLDPVPFPNGTVIIRDEYSASVDTLEVSLRVMREARAERRVLVLTDFSDAGLNRRARLRSLAAAVSGWAGLLVLTGEEHEYGRRKAIESGMPPETVHSFPSLKQAAEFVKTELRPGDLVLLKGRTTDHATRLFFAQLGTVACWREPCRKTMLCDSCWELGFRPADAPQPAPGARRAC
ncbi:MAG: UDP-N-acetylmuramoyl-tripeptide--D-alanyl-D-alanine ligase [Bryobacteraceae bacterium]|jgi:UDP-N-acetylmuramoyl-tripeptide--D-alanyl-D-alanine ligase